MSIGRKNDWKTSSRKLRIQKTEVFVVGGSFGKFWKRNAPHRKGY